MKLVSIKHLTTAALLLAALSWVGCDPAKTHNGPDCNIANADLSYNKNIKGIIDQQCISCHQPGSGVQGAVGDFRNYNGLKSYINNDKILDNVVIDKTMPQGGGMSQAQRDSINCWLAADAPEN